LVKLVSTGSSSPCPTCNQTPNAGKRICVESQRTWNGKGAGTITCHAYKNGVYGIVTCGHVVNGKGNMDLINQSQSWNPTYQYLFNSNNATIKLNSNCDAAFIPLENQSQKSRDIWNKGTTNSHYFQYCPDGINNQNVSTEEIFCSAPYLYQNMPIMGYGSTSGCQVGKVLATNFSQKYSSVERGDSLKLSFASVAGDSGGPIGCLWNAYAPNSNGTMFKLVGIITASNGDPSGCGMGGGPALCQRWSNVQNELGVSLYMGQ
jgi:hypothetical protein